MGLRKINTIGLQQANKVMYLSAIAFNLKKYLKFNQKRVKSRAKALQSLLFKIDAYLNLITLELSPLNLS
jgi:hypothetical protein